MNYPINIPDSKGSWPINFDDTVSFVFSADQQEFSASPLDAFWPPLPSGGFVSGDTIGPYKPNEHKTTVTFRYDNSELTGMHTILIGN
jgi:hypothetical protein